jgi:hypothetical protein
VLRDELLREVGVDALRVQDGLGRALNEGEGESVSVIGCKVGAK